jgi:hypothetical protein
LAERRKTLIAGSDRRRAEFAAIFGGIEYKLGVAEAVVAGARRLHRHRFLVGAAGVVMLLAPAYRSWVRRVMWLAPLALEGYRTVKAHAEERRASRG